MQLGSHYNKDVGNTHLQNNGNNNNSQRIKAMNLSPASSKGSDQIQENNEAQAQNQW